MHRAGCKFGEECRYLHPTLCQNSVRLKMCLNDSCQHTRLRFTKRKQTNENTQQNSYNRQTDQRRNPDQRDDQRRNPDQRDRHPKTYNYRDNGFKQREPNTTNMREPQFAQRERTVSYSADLRGEENRNNNSFY